eukprot:TRINITY_DN12073_c0_g1_i1.p1 TRINITY_DN12073_c0_g1~~TRINITY_DN12073_c0_g1_i1.p1  ORF type:complete len:126 (+),score=18.36 TRINITY_DN12073_c0_g1_i1:331-708(+)
MMTLFNLLNSRKINDETRIFSGLSSNSNSVYIFWGLLIIHVIIVEFGGRVFGCHFEGLNLEQWLICLGFGIFGNLLAFLLKRIPEKKIFPGELDYQLEFVSAASSRTLDKHGQEPLEFNSQNDDF